MSSELANCCICYGLYDDKNIIGFMAILHQPNARNKKIKRVSRLVILPDYQGIGLGTKFLNFMAEYYKKLNYDFCIVTSAKNLIYALKKSEKWCLYRYSKKPKVTSKTSKIDKNRKLRECITAGFMFK